MVRCLTFSDETLDKFTDCSKLLLFSLGLSDEITFLMPWTKGNDTLSHNAYKEGK